MDGSIYSSLDGADAEIDRIASTFIHKTLLITGGTGFVGKVLIEKLLRKCPLIKEIIMIVRPKKGKQPQARVEEILKGVLFEKLISMQGYDNILAKITILVGDTGKADLGLSAADRVYCQRANIIVHSAATVRFDEGLKNAVVLNTRGTKLMLELATTCPHLELYMQISTSYCHPEISWLEERTYPPPADPFQVISTIEAMDEATIDALTTKMLGVYPNTYAYSKSLAEAVVESYMDRLPVVILRPSIVIQVYQDPIPGWIDNINGPTGVLIGAGKGVIRTMYGNPKGHADFIPVDIVVNIIMAAAWDILKNGNKMQLMNLTTSEEFCMPWEDVISLGIRLSEERVPFDWVLWFPGGGMTNSRVLHRVRSMLFHWLPAILIDVLLLCLLQRPVLMRIQHRISKGMQILEYYTSNQWGFTSQRRLQLQKKMTPDEKAVYKMDAEDLDVYEYFVNGAMAARKYILREKDENLPRARVHIKIMKYVDYFFTYLFYGLIIYWFYGFMAKKLSVLFQ